MSEFVFWYLLIGVALVLMGAKFHASAWGNTYRESLFDGLFLWVPAALFWPLALDLILLHEGYPDD